MNIFLLKHGPEIRTYSSKLYYKELANSLVLYFNEYESKNLKDYQKKFRFDVKKISLEKKEKSIFFKNIERIFYFLKKRYVLYSGEKQYSHDAKLGSRIKENKLFVPIIFSLLYVFNIIYQRLLEKTVSIKNSINNLSQIEKVYIAGYDLSYYDYLLTIKKNNPMCKIIFILHSEKDLYIDSFIPYICTEYHVWKKENDNYIKKTFPFNKAEIKVVGVPRFKSLENLKSNENNKTVKVVYICSHENIIQNEAFLIEKIVKSFIEANILIEWYIRLNPMINDASSFEKLLTYSNVSLNYPNWEWNEKLFFNMPSYNSEKEFEKILINATFFLGGISTVAQEASILKKQYLALLFDCNKSNEKLRKLLKSPFYVNNILYKQVIPIGSINKLLEFVKNENYLKIDKNSLEVLRKDLLAE